MNEPLVSVLLPVYNSDAFIARALESILHQDYKNLEIVVVNDGSTDQSAEIIKSYSDSRIHFIDNKENKGIVSTLNIGLEACNGRYIARMDADDYSFPERISKQVSLFRAHPSLVLCGTQIQSRPFDINMQRWIKNNGPITNHIRLLFSNIIAHPTAMVDGDVIRKNNIRYNESFLFAEDYLMWCTLADFGTISNIEEPLLEYRIHAGSVSQSRKETQMNETKNLIKTLLKNWLQIEPSHNELDVHLALGNYKRKEEVTHFDKSAIAWIQKLLAQNEKIQKWPQKDFEIYLSSLYHIPKRSITNKILHFLLPHKG